MRPAQAFLRRQPEGCIRQILCAPRPKSLASLLQVPAQRAECELGRLPAVPVREKRKTKGESTLNYPITLVAFVTEGGRNRRPTKCTAESHVHSKEDPQVSKCRRIGRLRRAELAVRHAERGLVFHGVASRHNRRLALVYYQSGHSFFGGGDDE